MIQRYIHIWPTKWGSSFKRLGETCINSSRLFVWTLRQAGAMSTMQIDQTTVWFHYVSQLFWHWIGKQFELALQELWSQSLYIISNCLCFHILDVCPNKGNNLNSNFGKQIEEHFVWSCASIVTSRLFASSSHLVQQESTSQKRIILKMAG